MRCFFRMHLAGRATFLLSASKLVQICPLLLCSGVRPDVSLVGGVRGLRGRGHLSRMGLKAVTFDLDDTLWETMPSLKRASELHMQYLREKCPTVQIDMDSLRAEMLLVRDTLDDGGADLSILRRKTLESIVRKAGYDDCENGARSLLPSSVFASFSLELALFSAGIQECPTYQSRTDESC